MSVVVVVTAFPIPEHPSPGHMAALSAPTARVPKPLSGRTWTAAPAGADHESSDL